jgi:excisionase family DNA binding protein
VEELMTRNQQAEKAQGLLTVEEFAQMLGLQPATVRQKIWRREVEFVRIGRAIRFKPETANRIIESGIVPASR